jgi:O-antigen/teichoic acid export membrane protein
MDEQVTSSETLQLAEVQASSHPAHSAVSGLLSSVTGALVWNTLFLPIKTLVSFVANVVLVRALTQDDFGVFVAVTALLATIGLYVDLGIERSLIRFVPDVEQSYGQRGLIQFFITLIAVKLAILIPVIVALFLRLDFFAEYFHWGNLARPISVMVSVLLVFGALSDVLYQYLLAFFRQGSRNALDVLTTLLQSGILILLIALGYGVVGALLALTLATIANVVIGAGLVWRMLRAVQPASNVHRTWVSIYTRLAKFSALSFLMNLSTYFYDLPFVIVVLSYFNDLAGVALFGLAFSRVVMPVLRMLFTPLTGVQMPMFARLRTQENASKFNEAYVTLTRLLILLLMPAAVGLALVAQPLVVLFFQARYAASAPVVALLALFLFAESMLGSGEIVLLVYDRYRFVFFARACALVSIPLLFLLTPQWGAAGAAVAIGSPRLLSRLISTINAQRDYQLQFPSGFLVRVAAASLVMAAAVWPVMSFFGASSPIEHAVKLASATLLGAAVFLLLFKLLGGLELRDKQRFLTLPIPFKHLVVRWL